MTFENYYKRPCSVPVVVLFIEIGFPSRILKCCWSKERNASFTIIFWQPISHDAGTSHTWNPQSTQSGCVRFETAWRWYSKDAFLRQPINLASLLSNTQTQCIDGLIRIIRYALLSNGQSVSPIWPHHNRNLKIKSQRTTSEASYWMSVSEFNDCKPWKDIFKNSFNPLSIRKRLMFCSTSQE